MNNKIYVAGMLSALLSACGGGSSGSDAIPGAENGDGNYFSAPDPAYVGTWIQTNNNYYTDSGDTFKMRRQTIIVTQVGDDYKFTDCITGDSLLASVNGDVVDFYSAGWPDLQIEDDDTLFTTVDSGFAKTYVELKRVSSDVSISLVAVDFSSPAPVSDWDQVCVETIVDINTKDEVKIKLVDEDNSVTVSMHAVLDGEIEATQYNFPSAVDDVSGDLASPALDAQVFNPTGTLVVSDGITKDLILDLLFQNSVDSNMVLVDGIIKFEPFWFSYE